MSSQWLLYCLDYSNCFYTKIMAEYLRDIKRRPSRMDVGKYKKKLAILKDFIREYIHENAALIDETLEVEQEILIRMEERRYFLRKLCQYESQTEMEVEALAKSGYVMNTNTPLDVRKSTKKRSHTSNENSGERKSVKPRKNPSKVKKKLVQPIPLDSIGRPVFPIELGTLTIHSLGEVLSDRKDFHCEEAIYPVGYVSTRIYGSLKDPTVKCMYTCKISDYNGLPRFEIASDDNCPPIIGETPDLCHSILLQRINDALSLNVVSTKPKGHDFFGLTHPTVLNLIQSSPGTRKCVNYKWSKFEVSKSGNHNIEDTDASVSFNLLQRSISYCRYKMAPDVLQKPSDDYYNSKDGLRDYLMS